MTERESAASSADRGASEVVGVVLLFGLVVAGVVVVMYAGAAAKEDVSTANRMESAEVSMQQLDAELGSLSKRNSGSPVADLDLPDREAKSVEVRTGDRLTLRIDGNPSCSASVPLDRITYDVDDGGSVTYQAGGVWKTTEGGTTMVSPPSVSFRKGTLDISVVDVAGTAAGDDLRAVKRVEKSRRLTTAKKEALFSEPSCHRPETVTVTVTSERFHSVWYRYLSDEMPEAARVTHDAAAGRVTVELPQKVLPERADDGRNDVVDFTDPSKAGRLVDTDADGDADRILVDKGAGNTYDASMTFLGAAAGHDESVSYWDNRTKRVKVPDNSSSRDDEPMEIAFVLDESGSMANPCDAHRPDDGCANRLEEVQNATQEFLKNDIPRGFGHRAAVIGYSTRHWYTRIYEPLTGNMTEARLAVDDLHPEADTPIGEAIQRASYHLQRNGDPSKNQVIVLLTDGKETNDADARWASRQVPGHITVYTVGVGAGVNDAVLRDVASNTGGDYYHVSDASDLGDVLDDIKENETEDYVWRTVEIPHRVEGRRIVHAPVTLEMSVGGDTTTPWARPGESVVERALNYGDTPASESVRVRDGEAVTFSTTFWSCADTRVTDDTASPPGAPSLSYNHSYCESVAGPKGTDEDMHVFTDGERIPTAAGGDDAPWWQRNLRATIPAKYTTASGDRFDLASNQVVVVFEAPDDGGATTDYNNAVFLYEVGNSNREVDAKWVLDLDVSVVETRDG